MEQPRLDDDVDVEKALAEVRAAGWTAIRRFGLTLGVLHVVTLVVGAWTQHLIGPGFFALVGVETTIIVATLFAPAAGKRATLAMVVGSFTLGSLALFNLGFTVGVGSTFILVCVAAAIFHGPRGGLVAWSATLLVLAAVLAWHSVHPHPNAAGTVFVPFVFGLRYAIAILVLSAITTSLVVAVFRRLERTTRALSSALVRERQARAAAAASERAAAHVQQIKSTGRLAGRVGHDLNNTLTPLVAHATWLEERFGDADPEARASVHEIVEAGRRAVKLAHELRAFSPRGTQSRSDVVVDELLLGTLARLRGTLPSGVRAWTSLGASGVRVHGDEGLLRASISKLVANSVDAMPDGGAIELASKVVTLPGADDPPAARVLPPGDYVELTVKDTGRGMDEATLDRLFEPFFSTKAPEATSGFGLAAVHGTVHSHEGAIAVKSKIGEGTTVHMWFPVLETPSSPLIAVAPVVRRALVADDEPAVRRVIVRVLERRGFECIEARDGGEALAILQREHERIGFAVLDSVMPELTGEAVLARLRELAPALPVLMVSGHVESALADEIGRDARVLFLGKPFTPSELDASIARLLGDGPPSQRASA